MENTPTGCGSDLLQFWQVLKNDQQSRRVHNSLQRLDFYLNSIEDFLYQPKLRPVIVTWCVVSYKNLSVMLCVGQHEQCVP